MKQFIGFVAGISHFLDRVAACCIVGIMALVVCNVLLREIFSRPILGTYEYVGFLFAAAIGLALASCAVQNGHIAVTFVVDRLSPRMQAMVDTVTTVLAIGFWALSAWYIAQYANSMIANGIVSPTAQVPFYPFVYLVSLGILALCLVLLVKLLNSMKKVAINK